MEEVAKIRLSRSFFTGKYCLRTDKGKRLTKWFKEYDEIRIGNFIQLETDVGTIVYHKNGSDLLYENYGYEDVYMYKLTEDKYYLKVNGMGFSAVIQLYNPDGSSINMEPIADIYSIGNDLIAVQEFSGKWGILDENLNCKVDAIYEEIFEFRNGFAIGYKSENDTTDLIALDQTGEIHITNVDGCVVEHLSKNLVVTCKNKKHGVYDTNGKRILYIVYDNIQFVRNHFILKRGEMFGLADLTGKVLYDCKHYRISETKYGFEIVTRQITDTTEYITV